MKKRKIATGKPIPGLQESVEEMDPASKIFVDKSMAIGHYLQVLLRIQGLRQKDLALALGKSEAEISKLLAGMHNYTLRTLSKLEAALQADLIVVPEKADAKDSVKFETRHAHCYRVRFSVRDEPKFSALKYIDCAQSKIEGKNKDGRTLQVEAA